MKPFRVPWFAWALGLDGIQKGWMVRRWALNVGTSRERFRSALLTFQAHQEGCFDLSSQRQ